MAVVLAEGGGIGVIDRGFRPGDIQPQLKEVSAVKRTQHGVISDPHTTSATQTLRDALTKMDSTRVGTLAVVDEDHRLVGLFTERDARFANSEALVSERMTPRSKLVCTQARFLWPRPRKAKAPTCTTRSNLVVIVWDLQS